MRHSGGGGGGGVVNCDMSQKITMGHSGKTAFLKILRSSQNVKKPRKDKGKGRARERFLPETVEYVDNLGEVSDSCSSLSSFGSISTDASSSSAIIVSDEECGTDSDSDSE